MNDLGITFRFIRNISFNLTQLISWILLVSAMTMLLAFSEMISSYENFFIAKLKSVYPNVFLYTAQKKVDPLSSEVSHEKEIFEIIWKEFDFSYDGLKSQTTANISLRSFSKEHIPPVLNAYKQQIMDDEPVIYMNAKFYEKLRNNTDYREGLYLRSYVDDEYHFFRISAFEMYDETEWILIPNAIAHTLFHETMFEHTVIYSESLGEEELFNLYSKVYPHLFLWSDKVPLFSRSSLAILKSAFGVIILTTLVLTVATIFIVLKSIIDEYVLYTKQVLRFGMNPYRLYAVLLSLFFGYISSIILLGYLFVSEVKAWLAPILITELSTSMITSLSLLMSLSFVISVVTVLGLFQFVYAAMGRRELV